MNNKTISILGCGWLGLPLGQEFVKMGWRVRGSTTSFGKIEHIGKVGIEPYLLKLDKATEINDLKDFLESKYLLINVPPGKGLVRPESFHQLAEKIQISPIEKVILVSSTSVYGNANGLVRENATDNLPDDSNRMLAIERFFQKNIKEELSVLRFAGLIGPNRHPGNFFRKGRVVKASYIPVNLIHLNDCIGLIRAIVNNDIWGEVFNGCADTHPSKSEFYGKAALRINRTVPVFDSIDTGVTGKIVSNEKVKTLLHYNFIHPDLMLMLDEDCF